MYHNFNFSDVLASSARAAWQVEDVLPTGAELDFRRRFLPEALARTDEIAFLGDDEKRVLNQIRGHEYLTVLGLVEEFMLIHLFRLFHQRFTEAFGTPCEAIGAAGAIAGLSPAARDRIAAVAPAFA